MTNLLDETLTTSVRIGTWVSWVLEADPKSEYGAGAISGRGYGEVVTHYPKFILHYLDKIRDRNENILEVHFICSIYFVLSWARGQARVEKTLSSTCLEI